MTNAKDQEETPQDEPLEAWVDNEYPGDDTSPSAFASEGEDYAVQRCLEAADALHRLYLLNIDFVGSGERVPPETLLDAIENLLRIVAAEPTIAWPMVSWQFLHEVSGLAKIVGRYGEAWRDRGLEWDLGFTGAILRAQAQRPHLIDPCDPEPRIVTLETIEELVEQKVTDGQIAKVYGWIDNRGNPDISKVKAAKRGELKPPETHTYPPSVQGPKRQPHLGQVDSCVALFDSQRMEAEGVEV
jgi:hypothetical protein